MQNRDLLLVIDMQNVYTKGQEWACMDTEGAAERVNRIIDSGICGEVIFTKYIASEHPQGVWRDYNRKFAGINSKPWLNELIPQMKEAAERHPCYTKSVYSSLAIPEVYAAAQRAERVVVAGVVAECCVLSTVLALIDAGFYTVYLTDGVSGLDRPKEEATERILSGLAPLHLCFQSVEEYLRSDLQNTHYKLRGEKS